MSRKIVLVAAAMMLSAPMAFAQSDGEIAAPTGDAAAGESAFRQCIACHVVVSPDGETLAGRNGRQGPNLYGIAGRAIGSVEDFNYSDGLLALNAAELVWEEENFVTYIQDPTGYIREASGDDSFRGSMAAQRLRGDTAGQDLYAYLYSLSNPAE